jgi:hypothetical protein
MTKIERKIVGYRVVTPEQAARDAVESLHELTVRPETLVGATYKVTTPLSDHALYITINDIILNPGTPDEIRRPFEIFINSKAMDHFQWIVALTRIISAVFRKGGEVAFLAEELRSVFDPKGGYFKKGGRYMPSLVAEIGDVLAQHLAGLHLMPDDGSLAQAARAMVAAKPATPPPPPTEDDGAFPPEATLCDKCHVKAVIVMDGCRTCLSCCDSKCS